MVRITRSSQGFTLFEILVVVSLIGLVVILIASAIQEWSVRNSTSRLRQERWDDAYRALGTFSRDVSTCHAILDITPRQITLWADDSDSDGSPGYFELIEYRWEPSRESEKAPWIRSTSASSEMLVELLDLTVGADSQPPESRHIVLQLVAGIPTDSFSLSSSAARRRD